VLIADAVGLGKTVQAGFAEALLCEDPHRDRTLILTPGGLRDQWRAELERLFGAMPEVMDAARLTHLRRSLPSHVNPWRLPGIVIAGIDFVKQPEVLAGVLETRWTLVVLDEAHSLTAHTDRHRAAHLVARSARYVLMLTATPHSGDEGAFRALCEIGSLGDQPLMLRRTRARIGITTRRRNRLLAVRPTAAEQRLHRSLNDYLGQMRRDRVMDVDTARLTAWVLLKRAASSAHALGTTLTYRRQVLTGRSPTPEQADLPLLFGADELTDDDAALPDALGLPGLRRRDREIDRLDRLIVLAVEAAEHDSKIALARRFVLRVKERVLLFTEFRDTLAHVAALLSPDVPLVMLHGAMTRRERQDAERAFTQGSARVLLATDAASEGLNLHHACRFVMNLDVPWNPVRLEQRIGRIDRIGQTRTVHAITLVARGAADGPILGRVAARLHRIRRVLGDTADTLGAIGLAGGEALDNASAPMRLTDYTAGRRFSAERHSSLVSIVTLLRRTRNASLCGADDTQPRVRRPGLPWATLSRRRRRRLGLPPGVLVFFHAQVLTATGSVAATACAAVLVEVNPALFATIRARRVVRECAAVAATTASVHLSDALEKALPAFHRRRELFRRRLEATLELVPDSPSMYQPGLFDRRAMTAALRERARRTSRRVEVRQMLARLMDDSTISTPETEPIAALLLR
jgi:superfamily II DNA or RNA helicase